ncbi:enoyl-CoA hydratase/isomerase family protein [Rugamonas apoptosis]|uniref:Enoyl-CoA hydratase/isomerase family protein n=1 Tax=Rugamonas apoptosis TaxID=2758570 RepID=A0A7W2F9Y2_9BURK|nr:enoyl-CoA hydratase-related protein [Rugamonas apoptosis]MBA5687862.1 enoyl-CoA hydratase/isomerase family protein [Rugamonas apoptosis]
MQNTDSSVLLARRAGAVLHLTINRPEARNAMNGELLEELIAAFEAVAACAEVRAVVLRGAGGNFCAGGDAKDFALLRRQDAAPGTDPVAAFNRRFGALLELVNGVPQAVVVVAEGAVLGGGFGLACVADVAIVRNDANFGLPETSLGVIPAQIAPFVVQRIGLSQARRLGVCGGRFDGAEAYRLGLAHYVEYGEAALAAREAQVLGQIMRCAPGANAVTKQIMLAVGGEPLGQVLDRAATLFSAALCGPEAAEGTQAFMEKRLPQWAVAGNVETGEADVR